MNSQTSRPLYSLHFTVLLLLVLFIPFTLRTLSTQLEPYPAILMPSGAGKVRVDNEIITYRVTKFYGQNADSEWLEITASQLIDPIPVQYVSQLLAIDFGLTELGDDVPLRLRGDHVVGLNLGIPNSQSEREEAGDWMADNLREIGLAGDNLRVATVQLTIHADNGDVLAEEVIDERIIPIP